MGRQTLEHVRSESILFDVFESWNRRTLNFQFEKLTVNLDEISTGNLWIILNKTFTRIQNISFDRYLFLTRKQQKGEPIEKFYGHIKNFPKIVTWKKREIPLSEMVLLKTCKVKIFKKAAKRNGGTG